MDDLGGAAHRPSRRPRAGFTLARTARYNTPSPRRRGGRAVSSGSSKPRPPNLDQNRLTVITECFSAIAKLKKELISQFSKAKSEIENFGGRRA